jgi:hypothetical protein
MEAKAWPVCSLIQSLEPAGSLAAAARIMALVRAEADAPEVFTAFCWHSLAVRASLTS